MKLYKCPNCGYTLKGEDDSNFYTIVETTVTFYQDKETGNIRVRAYDLKQDMDYYDLIICNNCNSEITSFDEEELATLVDNDLKEHTVEEVIQEIYSEYDLSGPMVRQMALKAVQAFNKGLERVAADPRLITYDIKEYIAYVVENWDVYKTSSIDEIVDDVYYLYYY